MTTDRLAQYLSTVPSEVAEALENEYAQLESRFARGDWDPAELNGGRFAEAVLRYLEWKQSGMFTPLGARLDRTAIINRITSDATLPEGVRFHVRRCADLLLDVRNKRDVAHLGESIDVKEMDSKLVMRLSSWSLAEILREESGLDPEEVQQIVDRLSATHFPLVEEIGGELVVVAKNLPARLQALVALYHSFPDPMPLAQLQKAVKYGNATRFRQLMESESEKGITHLQGNEVYLTRGKGVPWVEKNVDMRMNI